MSKTDTEKKQLTDAEAQNRIKELNESLKKIEDLNAKASKFKAKLKNEKKSAVGKSIGFFAKLLPFKEDAYEAIKEASISLFSTIILFNLGILIWLGALFCAIIDALFILLSVPCFPFACLYFALAKNARVKKFEEAIKDTESRLERYNVKEIADELKALDKQVNKYPSSSSNSSINSGITETDYYKRQCEIAYARLMNLPVREIPLSEGADSIPSA